MFESNLLSWVVFVPLLGVAVLLVLPRVHDNVIRGVALVTTLLNFLVSLLVLQRFETSAALQFVERVPWIPAFDIEYYIGLDGISLWLVLLTTFLGPIIVLSTWSAVTDRVREFMVFYLILQAAMLGTFSAQDMVLFYVFWEAVLLPMALMIGIWGGERRIYAAVKFVLYTMVGSVLMLVAVLYMYSKAGSFSFAALAQTPFTFVEQAWLFGAFTLAFAIKVPVFPVHTWLPDAHVEAPTAGSVVLAGVMLKMGTYGLIRLSIPFFPRCRGVRPPARSAGSDRDRLRCAGGHGAARREEAGGLQLGEPSGFRRAGSFRHVDGGCGRCDLRHAGPRSEHGYALPPGGRDLRAAAHAQDQRLRRAGEGHADLRPSCSWWPRWPVWVCRD